MTTDKEKLAQLEMLLEDFGGTAEAEMVSLALSVADEEERDMALLSLARGLANAGRLDKAWGAAQFINGYYEKAQVLSEIAGHLARVGDLERAWFIFSEATANATAKELALWQQAELLLEIAKLLRQCGAVYKANEVRDKAIAVAQHGEAEGNPQDSLDCVSVLCDIVFDVAQSGQTEKAGQLAQSIRSAGHRERVLARLPRVVEQFQRVA